MTDEKIAADADMFNPPLPVIHKIGIADLKEVLAKGIADFSALPTHLAFLCMIYPLVIIGGARVAAGYDVLQLVFPLLAGYTLIGPLVAVGMYELSRQREQGLATSRRHAFDVFRSASTGSIAILGALLMAIYFMWLFVAQVIYIHYIGFGVPDSIMEFADQILTTKSGWMLIIAGNGAGFVFAAIVFSLSVVSFPLLVDRDASVTMAITTSVRAVIANPVSMAVWGLIVAASLLIGSLPFFVGLAVVLPVLGHASWHLYRKVVEF